MRSFIAVPYFLLLIFCVTASVFVAVGTMRRKKVFVVSGVLFIALVIGVFRFDGVMRVTLDTRVLGDHTFRGIVYEEPERNPKSQELHVAVSEVNGIMQKKIGNALITTAKYPAYAIGDEIVFFGEMKKPENFADFDYGSYLRGKNILMVSAFPVIEKVGEGRGNSIRLALSRVKKSFEEKIDMLFRDPYGALLKGLLLGERSQLPEEFLEALRITGTTHIVALSGYNITLVGASLLSLLLFCTVSFRMAFWASSSFIVLFIVMTGASASVVRAGIMGLLVLVAQNEGRAYRMTNALVFAASVMIFYNPLILRFDAGFQLSFLATCGILYLPSRVTLGMARMKEVFYKKGKVKALEKEYRSGRLETILVETLSAQVLVLPLLLYLFGTISFISPFANIAVLAAVPFAMGFGFFSVIAGFLWMPLGKMISWIAWLILAYMVNAIEWFSRVPYASLEVSVVPWYVLVGAYGIITVWIIKNRPTAQ